MPVPLPREPGHPEAIRQLSTDSDLLSRRLYRPIVFRQPDRLVHPASWLEHIPFGFWLVEAMRPSTLVELGTHSGNSYAAFAQAIKMLGLTTAAYAVDTWEGDVHSGLYDESVYVEWAAYHDRHFSAFSRLIRSTFEEAVRHFADGSVDLLHIDGCHTYEAASGDFARWRPKLSQSGIVLFHDTNVRQADFGAWQLWNELCQSFPSFEFLHGHGLGVLGVGPNLPEPVRWLLTAEGRDPTVTATVREFFATLGGAVRARLAEHDKVNEVAAVTSRASAAEALVAERDTALQQRDASVAELTAALVAARHDCEASQQQVQTSQALAGDFEARLREADRDREAQAARLQAVESERSRLEDLQRAQARLVAGTEERHRRQLAAWHRPFGQADGGAIARAVPPASAEENAAQRGLKGIRRVAATPAALGLVPSPRRGLRRPPVQLLLARTKLREAAAVVNGGLFDEAYYSGSNADVRASRMTPLAHFVLRGGTEGRNPHALFDAAYYLRRNPDVAATLVNPLLHYQQSGAFEGRNPHPLFDVSFYLRNNPDVEERRIEPLRHFLRFGAKEGRNPNEFFDCAYYLRQNPDVAAGGLNPLVHFAVDGWRERRQPSGAFDVGYYLDENPDVAASGENPLAHYLERGRREGRRAVAETEDERRPAGLPDDLPAVPFTVTSLAPGRAEPRTVVCLSHVMPVPPRAGNEYRIFRLLRWFREQGYRVVPIIAPLPNVRIEPDAVRRLADEFGNAVLCDRDGRVDYVLGSVPDVLQSLSGDVAGPVALLLGEPAVLQDHAGDLLRMDRLFCHDALISVVMRLQQALGPHVLLAEYIWMTRIFPLAPEAVVKVIDTHDVFSTKRDKVLRFGVEELHIEPHEEAARLRRADLVIAIQDEERRELTRLAPGTPVVTGGVDFDVVGDPGTPSGRVILYVASGNSMNRKGLADFLGFAWRRVREHVPDAELMLAGDICDTLTVDVPGVTRLGRVPDLTPLYRKARLVINPNVAGTGLKIKTLEALGHCRTVVTWPSGVEGIAPELAALCVVVQDWYAFGQELVRLLLAESPASFSVEQCGSIKRLMAPETAYGDLTSAIEAMLQAAASVKRD